MAKLITVPITHRCPYKSQDIALAVCYVASQDIGNTECYACDHVPMLKREYGLRCYIRKLLADHIVDRPLQLYVATNREGTEWMVVNSHTGERKTLQEHAVSRNTSSAWESLAKPLAGAPGTSRNGVTEEERQTAAVQAQKSRSCLRYEGTTKKKRKSK